MKPLTLLLMTFALILTAAGPTPSSPTPAGGPTDWTITAGSATDSDTLASQSPAHALAASWKNSINTPAQIALRLKLTGSAKATITLTQVNAAKPLARSTGLSHRRFVPPHRQS